MIRSKLDQIKRELEIFKTVDNKGKECPVSITSIERKIEDVERMLGEARNDAVDMLSLFSREEWKSLKKAE